MSGHSKWSTIKRQKGVADSKRSQIFTKLANTIAVAARQGADPVMNFKLRLAIDKAREVSMPKENIDRAIKRGSGGENGLQLEEITYEGYGPGGVAFLIETVTNNRNRTAPNIRHLLEKNGGRFAENGSVAWLFESKGIIQIKSEGSIEDLELGLIEVGATDIKEESNNIIIICEPPSFDGVKKYLLSKNINVIYSNIEPIAKTTVEVDEVVANKLDGLRTALDDDEEINNFYDNAV